MLKTAMAEVYYKLVIKGKMTLEEVPEKWREEVRKMLEGITKDTEGSKEEDDGLIAHRPE